MGQDRALRRPLAARRCATPRPAGIGSHGVPLVKPAVRVAGPGHRRPAPVAVPPTGHAHGRAIRARLRGTEMSLAPISSP